MARQKLLPVDTPAAPATPVPPTSPPELDADDWMVGGLEIHPFMTTPLPQRKRALATTYRDLSNTAHRPPTGAAKGSKTQTYRPHVEKELAAVRSGLLSKEVLLDVMHHAPALRGGALGRCRTDLGAGRTFHPSEADLLDSAGEAVSRGDVRGDERCGAGRRGPRA